MKNTGISNHASLVLRIAELRADKLQQEDELKDSFEAFTKTLSPLSMLKGSMQGFVKDKELRSDILKAGLNLGTDFIIEKVLGRSRSVKGFLSSILVEKLSTPFINNTVTKIFSGISKPKQPDPEQGTTP